MKLNKTLLIAALSLFAASGLMAKPKVKEEIPGIAPQPASFFYTGKPFDKDLGEYTFAFRNYNPQMARWTSADPSGFPDGANPYQYVRNLASFALDAIGFNTYVQTQIYTWQYSASSAAPASYNVTASSVIANATLNVIVNETPNASFNCSINGGNAYYYLAKTSDNGAPTSSGWVIDNSNPRRLAGNLTSTSGPSWFNINNKNQAVWLISGSITIETTWKE